MYVYLSQAPVFRNALMDAPIEGGGKLTVDSLVWSKIGAYCTNQQGQFASCYENVLVAYFNGFETTKAQWQQNYVATPQHSMSEQVFSIDFVSFIMRQVT